MRGKSTLLLGLALIFAAPAAAQDAQPQPQTQNADQLDEAARLTFESAREAFVNGEYERALGLFRQSYQLSNRPGLLYNIAQTLDRLRRDAEALEAFREFLSAQPDTPNRGEVEARIRVLEQAVANNRPSEDPVTGEPRRDPGIGIFHPGIFIGFAAAALGSGAVLIWSGLETMSLRDQYEATTTLQEAERLYNAASDQQLLTNVFIGVTAALGAAAVVFGVLSDWGAFGGGGGESASLRPQIAFGPDGAFLGLESSF